MNLPASPAATASAAPLFELDRATVVRGATRVLHNLSLTIPLGQHTAILGPNGGGKSTFIKLINRELYPLAREGDAPVKVFGLRRWNVNELRNRLGVVTSDLTRDLQQMPYLRVDDAVVTGFFSSLVVPPHRQIDDDMRDRARRALEAVRAIALADRHVAELSTGEMRRVLIARALVHEPQALLLDEPTAGLDLVARQHFLGLMRLLAQRGITLVLVTHHIEEIIPEIDRVLLLRGGAVYADGDRAATLTDAHLGHAFGGPVRVRCEDGFYSAVPGHA